MSLQVVASLMMLNVFVQVVAGLMMFEYPLRKRLLA
jgi:hypothetical protein